MAKDKKKSVIEEALLDAKLLRETLNNNTKEILRSVSREEINGAINESFGDEEEEDIDTDMEDAGADLDIDVEAGSDLEADDAADDFGGDSEADLGIDAGSEEGSEDFEDLEGMASDEDDYEFDMTTASDDEVISVFKKLSGEDEIEVIDDNEVHIKDPSGSEYHVKLGGGAAAPEVGVEAPAEEDEFDIDSDMEAGGEEDFGAEEDGDMDYEIELDGDMEDEEGGEADEFGADEEGDDFGADEEDEEEDGLKEDIVRGKGHDKYASGGSLPSGDIEGQKAEKDSDSGDNLTGGFDDDAVSHANAEGPMVMEDEEEDLTEMEIEINEEDEIEEQIRQGQSQSRRVPGKAEIGQPNGPGAVVEAAQYNKLLKQYKALMSENKEFKGALKEFRTMLNEVAIFNSNLTYATRLFTEHSTTKEEKQEILKKFDNEAGSLKESKKVFKTLQEGLKKRTPLNEGVAKKIEAEPKTSSKSQINESTAYVDNSTKRMIELMRKLK